jgi:hypothetical protein
VPYGWQFAGEEVFMPAAKGAGLNCFALLSRTNDLLFETTRQRITGRFIIEQLERLSFSIQKLTVVVLDNAGVHTSRQVQERRPFWQRRGLFLFYRPPYLCVIKMINEMKGRRLRRRRPFVRNT